jgi:hypothetical protein
MSQDDDPDSDTHQPYRRTGQDRCLTNAHGNAGPPPAKQANRTPGTAARRLCGVDSGSHVVRRTVPTFGIRNRNGPGLPFGRVTGGPVGEYSLRGAATPVSSARRSTRPIESIQYRSKTITNGVGVSETIINATTSTANAVLQ